MPDFHLAEKIENADKSWYKVKSFTFIIRGFAINEGFNKGIEYQGWH